MSDAPRSLIVGDLMKRVGYVLLYWGLLETGTQDAVRSLNAASGSSEPLTLEGWLQAMNSLPSLAPGLKADARHAFDEAQAQRQARHLLAHGLVNAYAGPEADPPRVECRDRSGVLVPLSYDELHRVSQAIDRARISIHLLTVDALRPHQPARR